MPVVKVSGFTRKSKGKTIKVKPHTRNVKTKPSKGGKPRKPRKPATAAQKKARHDWYQKNRTKILQKRKQKHPPKHKR